LKKIIKIRSVPKERIYFLWRLARRKFISFVEMKKGKRNSKFTDTFVDLNDIKEVNN
jgi:hypothetical protein